MLRASAEVTTTPLDARAITDPAIDPLLPYGQPLLAFVEAVLTGSGLERAATRNAVLEAVGSTGLVDTAGVIAGASGLFFASCAFGCSSFGIAGGKAACR